MKKLLLVLLAIGLGTFSVVSAEEENGWSDAAEFSYVVTAGNSESSTLGFKNTATRKWTEALFTLNAGGIRVETTTTTRVAVAPDPMDLNTFIVVESDSSETTAENYYLDGRYDRKITESFFWFAGAGWDRNRFAGVENRYVIEGGAGNVLFDEDDHKFRISYGLTYTDQEDVVLDPTADDTFVGGRVGWNYMNKFGANTTYKNVLVMDINLDETDDWRGNMVNSVAVAMSERLALKVSLQWLYDNNPSLTTVPLESPAGTPTGLTRSVQLDELDSLFTVSLVVNF